MRWRDPHLKTDWPSLGIFLGLAVGFIGIVVSTSLPGRSADSDTPGETYFKRVSASTVCAIHITEGQWAGMTSSMACYIDPAPSIPSLPRADAVSDAVQKAIDAETSEELQEVIDELNSLGVM